ncbi:ribosomal protein S7 domain-containing protein [Phlebopus sp. FC_14]|nr:ribosomal protein S7 domain-containing protein [Phlebopus sp. FC_14]
MSTRLAASASQAARLATNNASSMFSRAAISFASSRRRHFTSPADQQTLAKSSELLDALVGSTAGINLNPPPPTPAPKPTKPSTSADTNMFIPPANDPLLGHLTSALQKRGHRARAARLVSRMLLHIHAYTRAPPMPIVREAVLMVSPAVKCAAHKHATKIIQTPYALTEKQRIHAGVKALLTASESKPGKTVDVRLAREMIAILQGQSAAIDEKVRIHKLAMVNKGNVH